MKNKYKYIIFMLIILVITGVMSINALASVNISVESYNKTITEGRVNAETFRDAALIICSENDIPIILNADGTEIQSINGIANNTFTVHDCWQGYIFRDGALIQTSDILNEELLSNDSVVIYYGHISDTKIVTNFDFYEKDGKINFNISSSGVAWHEREGEWISGNVTEYLENIKINITEPSGTRKIVQTNSEGFAESPILSGGVYKFYAEGYNRNKYPSIVRTPNYIYFKSESVNITRAEACAFLVQAFELKLGNSSKNFSDVNENTAYALDIKIAAANGIISGFENGEFKPDEPINLLQLAVMFSNIYPEYPDGQEYININENAEAKIPEWALMAVRKTSWLEIFKDIYNNWKRPVTSDDLSRLYLNVCGIF